MEDHDSIDVGDDSIDMGYPVTPRMAPPRVPRRVADRETGCVRVHVAEPTRVPGGTDAAGAAAVADGQIRMKIF